MNSTSTLFFLTLLMLSSLAVITLSIRTIPFLRLPTSLHHVTSQISDLKAYSEASNTQFLHLATILSMIFIWKQAFSIPGTILLNVLIGAIYGTWFSTLLTCFLTAIGSTCAYQMARSIRPIVLRIFPTPLGIIERAVDRFKLPGNLNRYDTAELSSYLLIARFLPVVPYAALNLASGVLELPLVPFFWTLVLGSLPYNFLTTQVGDILSTVTASGLLTDTDQPNLSKIWSNALLLKLAFISILGALPVLFKNQLRESIQALAQTRRSNSSPLFSFSKKNDSNKRRLERHQTCREWVSDIGSKRKSLSLLDLSDARRPLNFVTPAPDACPTVHLDHHPDNLSELSRTTSSSSLSTQERERFSIPTPPLVVINFDPLTSDEDSSTTPIQQPFSTTSTTITNTSNIINHPLPLVFSKNPPSKTNNSFLSLFDLPLPKVSNLVDDHLVLPK